PGAELGEAGCIVCHHFDLLAPSEQSRVLRSEVVLAAALEPPASSDRFGLIVHLVDASVSDQRLAVLETAPQHRQSAATEDLLRQEVEAARRLLPRATIEQTQLHALTEVALSLAIEGNRADYFAALAARASAALDGRLSVINEDLETAVKLVLAPRGRAFPAPATDTGPQWEGGQNDEPNRLRSRSAGEPEPLADSSPQARNVRSASLGGQHDGRGDGASTELLLAVAASALPPDLFQRSHRAVEGAPRGRFIRAIPAQGRCDRPAVAATLRAAMPWQRLRGWSPGQRLRIRKEDLRRPLLSEQPSTLHLVLIDASGSMVSNRMGQAKGVIVSLLRAAYVHRDRVALIAFRRREAKLLLAPTRSLSLARRALEQLPSGGGTPLRAGLDLALDVLRKHLRRQAQEEIRLTLLTDGRVGEGPWRQYGQALAQLGARVAVVDTRSRFTARGEAESLAEALGGSHVLLGNAAENMPRRPRAGPRRLAFAPESSSRGGSREAAYGFSAALLA
ncbi:MAG: VWA domain-containing protein, partial [Chloroflexota bacterium]|nr:VWA domain-containing protein [Chloroflexota bacterium]